MVHLILNGGFEHVEKLTGHPPLQKMCTERATGHPKERQPSPNGRERTTFDHAASSGCDPSGGDLPKTTRAWETTVSPTRMVAPGLSGPWRIPSVD